MVLHGANMWGTMVVMVVVWWLGVLLQPRIDVVSLKYHGVEGSSIGTVFISTVTTIKVLSL